MRYRKKPSKYTSRWLLILPILFVVFGIINNQTGKNTQQIDTENANFTITQKAVDHIIYRHWPNTSFDNVSKFNNDISIETLHQIIKTAIQNGNSRPERYDRTVYEYEFNYIIGRDIRGNASNKLRVVLARDGSVITAYPI